MAEGTATVAIHRAPGEILEFMMDIERYRVVDPRLHRVHWARRDGNRQTVKISAKLAGVPAPAMVQTMTLTPGRRIDIRQDHWTARFHGSLECTPTQDGSRVVRRLRFEFSPVLRWFMDPLFRRWLARDVPAEMARLKTHLEADSM